MRLLEQVHLAGRIREACSKGTLAEFIPICILFSLFIRWTGRAGVKLGIPGVQGECFITFLPLNDLKFITYCLSLGHARSRDHRIARVVTNLGDVRLVTTTKDQSLGFIYGLPLMLFGKMHFMIGCDNIRTVM